MEGTEFVVLLENLLNRVNIIETLDYNANRYIEFFEQLALALSFEGYSIIYDYKLFYGKIIVCTSQADYDMAILEYYEEIIDDVSEAVVRLVPRQSQSDTLTNDTSFTIWVECILESEKYAVYVKSAKNKSIVLYNKNTAWIQQIYAIARAGSISVQEAGKNFASNMNHQSNTLQSLLQENYKLPSGYVKIIKSVGGRFIPNDNIILKLYKKN